MSIQITDEALEVLKRSMELGGIGEAGGVRIFGARGLGGGFDVQVEFAEEPLGEEEVVDCEGVRVFLDPAVKRAVPDPVIAVEPQHETVVVRPGEPA